MNVTSIKGAQREILLSFWKVHILYHAGSECVHGQQMLTELRRHGYELSPGTLYPLLKRMEKLGWLKAKTGASEGRRARRDYRLTAKGAEVLALVRQQIQELHDEVVLDHDAT